MELKLYDNIYIAFISCCLRDSGCFNWAFSYWLLESEGTNSPISYWNRRNDYSKQNQGSYERVSVVVKQTVLQQQIVKPSPYMKRQEARMLWTVLFTGENGHKRRSGDAAFCLWQFCVVWSVCSLTHWTHYFDLAESVSPASLALESVKAGVCKLYWVKAEASGWVGKQGRGLCFAEGFSSCIIYFLILWILKINSYSNYPLESVQPVFAFCWALMRRAQILPLLILEI